MQLGQSLNLMIGMLSCYREENQINGLDQTILSIENRIRSTDDMNIGQETKKIILIL